MYRPFYTGHHDRSSGGERQRGADLFAGLQFRRLPSIFCSRFFVILIRYFCIVFPTGQYVSMCVHNRRWNAAGAADRHCRQGFFLPVCAWIRYSSQDKE